VFLSEKFPTGVSEEFPTKKICRPRTFAASKTTNVKPSRQGQKNRRKKMDTTEMKQEDIRMRAENLMVRTELLINQLDNWLPSDAANANLEREIRERNRKQKATGNVNRWKSFVGRIKSITAI
jgi:hypothetical protein